MDPPRVAVVPAPNTSKRSIPGPQRQRSRPGDRTPRAFEVRLPRGRFCVCWWLVLGFHAVVGAYTAGVMALNDYLRGRFDSHQYMALRIPKETFEITARSFLLLTVFHGLAILRLVWISVRARELTFRPLPVTEVSAKIHVVPASMPHVQGTTASFGTTVPVTASRLWSISRRLAMVLLQAWELSFGRQSPFGLNGRYFEAVFIIRESVEILLQSFQAYQLSRAVPRRWLNGFAVSSVILNCLASPLVHVLFRHHDGWRRLLNLLQDAVLDFCASVVIPLCVFIPYVTDYYDRASGAFPDALVMDDVWYVNAISENRQVLITSLADYVSTVLPQLSILGCLMTIKNVLVRGDDPAVVTTWRSRRSENLLATRRSLLDRARASLSLMKTRGSERIHLGLQLQRGGRDPVAVTSRRQWALHGLFLLWAAAILGLHLDAQAQTSGGFVGCRLHVNSWLARGFSCSVMQLNCHRRGIRGAHDEVTAILGQLDPWALQMLVFTHCPALEMPPIITTFPMLSGLEIFNSTLVRWPKTAALDQATSPHLGFLYLARTAWDTFPEGLLQGHLPEHLTHLIIDGANVTELPEDIGVVWSRKEWVLLAIDHTPLRSLPRSFCDLRHSALSLIDTEIQELPHGCLQDQTLEALFLSGSPILRLPETVGDTTSLVEFLAEHTSVTELPEWLVEWLGADVNGTMSSSLFGSPVCDEPQSDLLEALCVSDSNSSAGVYPYDIMLPQRGLDM